MPANFVLLEKITVGAAGASSVTFSGIPQTGYTDLVVKTSARVSDTNDVFYVYFNNDTTNANYTALRVLGSGSAASSQSFALPYFDYASTSNQTASTFSSGDYYIPNYTSSNKKSISTDTVNENNAAAAVASLNAGLWSGTAAITSIKIQALTASFVQYSTFYLYGVAALGTTPAIAPYATGGDTIMTDGTYWYHAFLASGTFTPLKGLSCDVVVVAGGGGGGYAFGGGGGAGGLLPFTAQSISTAKTVTIGAGGAGGTSAGVNGSTGSDSQLGALTLVKGGGGGGYGDNVSTNHVGQTGGSGGGAGRSTNVSLSAGGSPTSGQGFAGGSFPTTGSNAGAGGGGAGAVGANHFGSSGGGAGGAGLNTYSAWASATGTGVSGYYAGGGGGGAYSGEPSAGAAGSGGGSAGGYGVSAGNATANTGGGAGGGGGNTSFNGGTGGSGIVLVRYAV